MLVLPVFPQDEPPPDTEITSELSDDIVDLTTKAEQGDASAQFYLGLRHELGLLNVPQDYTQAARWYGAAAEQGDVKAQFSLGFLYYEGLGVSQDYKEAVRWYRAAAEQGNADAQNNLGFMYDNGWGGPQDYIQAFMWYSLAASDLTDEDRETAVTNRDSVADKMTVEQITEAQRLAREWKPKTGSSK
jgi:hypothetical protein